MSVPDIQGWCHCLPGAPERGGGNARGAVTPLCWTGPPYAQKFAPQSQRSFKKYNGNTINVIAIHI